MVFKGARELEAAASMNVPDKYRGLLFTQGSVGEWDRFLWRGKRYRIEEVDSVEGEYDSSYMVAKFVFLFGFQPQDEKRL